MRAHDAQHLIRLPDADLEKEHAVFTQGIAPLFADHTVEVEPVRAAVKRKARLVLAHGSVERVDVRARDVRRVFYGNYASEKETADTIRDLYEKTGYVIDTHTAVAASVYHKYKKDTNDTDTKTVIASTASPFKFSRSVMDAIDPKYDSLSEFELVDELSRIGNVKIPQAIEEIRSAEVRHKTVCEVEEMPEVVKQFLGI